MVPDLVSGILRTLQAAAVGVSDRCTHACTLIFDLNTRIYDTDAVPFFYHSISSLITFALLLQPPPFRNSG